mgnify:CR=1 FL=1
MSKKVLFMALGNYLRVRREKAGYSQVQVSKVLGYGSSQFISNFERGLCAPPLIKLKKLVDLYKMPPKEVIGIIMKAQEAELRSVLKIRKGA